MTFSLTFFFTTKIELGFAGSIQGERPEQGRISSRLRAVVDSAHGLMCMCRLICYLPHNHILSFINKAAHVASSDIQEDRAAKQSVLARNH